MPPSKQARARQAKQKDRLAAAAARRQERRRRRQRAGATALIFMIVIVVVLAVVLNGVNSGTDSGKKATTPTTAPPTTVAPLASVKGKPCVALKDPLPKGAPNVPVQVGPPPTALVKKDLKVGTGAEVKAGATITSNYVGVACSTGKIFDSSVAEGGPQTFKLEKPLIQGWVDGIPGMKVGGVRVLGIPSDQAYKDKQAGANIAPNEALWFVVEVTAVK